MDASTEFHGPVTGHYTIPAPHASHGGSNNFYFNRRDTWSAAPKPCHIIPFPRNEDIVHRPDLFAELETLLPSTTSEYHSAALWGLGGSGCRDPACSVFWVHADNATTFAHDYKTLARKLGLDSKLEGDDLLVAVRERIESEPQYLLVLDNADDLALFGVGQTSDKFDTPTSLLDYIPRGPTGMVLWTSRDEHIAGTLVGPPRGIGVARMTVDEGRALLEMARNIKTTSEQLDDATALLEELQWLPLAISQAGAYMRRTSTSVNEYLSRLVEGKDRWRILNETELDRHRRLDVPNSILETWHISIDCIRQENEMAYMILHIIAYLDNQNIPLEVMVAAGTFDSNRRRGRPAEIEQLVDRAIIRLKEFSFVAARRTEGGERSFEMHKLVQEAVRYGLNTKRLLERKTTKTKLRLRDVITKSFRKHRVAEKGSWKDKPEVYFSNAALQVITDLFPESKRETWAQCETLLSHAVRVSDWAELGEKEVEASNLLCRVSDYLFDRGRWRENERVGVKVLELRREFLGEEHPDTLYSMRALALTYHGQGRYSEAEEIKLKVLKLQQEILGGKHPDTINTMENLATTYQDQTRYSEAEELKAQVLKLQREVLGEKHPDTIRAMGNLAATYHKQGRYNEAEEIKLKVLKLQQEVLGKEHSDTVRSMGRLAATYHSQGRYNEAEEIKVKVLELQRKVLGEEHPQTLRAMHNLAKTWRCRDRGDEAIALMEQCSQLRHRMLGRDHLQTQNSDQYLERWKTEQAVLERIGGSLST
ncbi:hypothetical protein AUP68_10121 [Ilyonectria robusta]